MGFKGVKLVARGYKVFIGGDKGLQGVKSSYKVSQGVIRGDRGLQEVRRLLGVTWA